MLQTILSLQKLFLEVNYSYDNFVLINCCKQFMRGKFASSRCTFVLTKRCRRIIRLAYFRTETFVFPFQSCFACFHVEAVIGPLGWWAKDAQGRSPWALWLKFQHTLSDHESAVTYRPYGPESPSFLWGEVPSATPGVNYARVDSRGVHSDDASHHDVC